ncbi:MAG TPA: hypothetical protein PK413_15565 [Thermoanaerobaculia bacterium]|nr:hypothetical protein [Thermoanaerobaculia bacterium]
MKKLGILAILLLLSALPVLAADPVIYKGIDVFTTLGNGTTFYDFAHQPIPAGFFCKGSAPFTGRVMLKGVPLQTSEPGKLRGTDTVIERLNDAVFDGSGKAVTLIKFRALSLTSVAPIQTSCGEFAVSVTLAGEQRATTMNIYRTEERGGYFVAPLAVDAKMSFVPVRGLVKAPLELVGSFTFPASALPWSFAQGTQVKQIASVVVDADRDGVAETRLPATSNFAPGWVPGTTDPLPSATCQRQCEPQTCHEDPVTLKQHCSGPINTCCTCACP